ncbi:MAG: polyprenyl synthetase family protein [Desulfobacteraceae bacterium]
MKRFDHHFRRINDDLGKSLASEVSLIDDITHYSLLGEGKRLRPLLFVLSSQLCGYQGEDVYHLSTIFEYIHAASLLHDDVLDNAETRRKKPSVRTVWGNPAAVLGGDSLYARASVIASECNNLDLVKMLSRVTGRMVEGQFLELEHTHNWHMTKEKYMDIIVAKTAALISAACTCGGIIAGTEEKAIEHLGEFGLNLGIAFQMIDDVLDYTSSVEVFGKPVGKDLKEGKITLPLIYILSDLEKAEIDKLEDLFKNHEATEKDYANIISMVRNHEVIESIRSEAVRYVEKSTRFLEFFPESSTKDDLLGLADYIVRRKF